MPSSGGSYGDYGDYGDYGGGYYGDYGGGYYGDYGGYYDDGGGYYDDGEPAEDAPLGIHQKSVATYLKICQLYKEATRRMVAKIAKARERRLAKSGFWNPDDDLANRLSMALGNVGDAKNGAKPWWVGPNYIKEDLVANILRDSYGNQDPLTEMLSSEAPNLVPASRDKASAQLALVLQNQRLKDRMRRMSHDMDHHSHHPHHRPSF